MRATVVDKILSTRITFQAVPHTKLSYDFRKLAVVRLFLLYFFYILSAWKSAL